MKKVVTLDFDDAHRLCTFLQEMDAKWLVTNPLIVPLLVAIEHALPDRTKDTPPAVKAFQQAEQR